MESWLAADTIRRMGFGHVVAAHRHTLIVERGVSFVAFDAARRSRPDGLRVEHLRAAAAVPHPAGSVGRVSATVLHLQLSRIIRRAIVGVA